MVTDYRIATRADAAAIAAIYAPYVTDTVVTFETDPPDAAEFERRIAMIGSRYPWLLAERDGTAVGYAYACEYRERAAYRWSVEVTVYLAPAAQRQGVGRALYARLFALLRRQNVVNAYGIVTLPNVASVALHEAFGFAAVGVYRHVGYKHGKWHDVGWFHLGIGQPWATPLEPVPFAKLDKQRVRDALRDLATDLFSP